MDPRVGLHGKAKKNLSFPCRESNSGHLGPSLVAIPIELKKCIRQQYRVVGTTHLPFNDTVVQRGE
jgi:hypothetical protein